ncbi:protein PTST homolog 2, chloroplastic-like isoform X2 [Lycium ferocissimum]|uniref:protein PTST homolog 2, chloroplastic-like isoform X2 n=1 Tax=Lycium ferocissimum TaxID=112874 RepID=UPI002816013A|nr:protein PTST homolog 2, chloroplastic-like isoform X2 [Lycium ferocissimum]
MVSLIFTRTNFLKPPVFNTLLSFSPKRFHCRRKAVIFNLVLGKNMCSFQFFNKLRKERTEDSVYCWCKKGDMELEEEILAFMKLSENPNAFPTRKELEKAGRVDLIEAIKKRGGWFSFGWEIEDDDKNVNANEVETVEMDFDIEEFHRRVESCQDSDLLHGNEAHLPASSSGRSIETVAEEDSGIEGILSRLEKERNSSLGIDLGKHGHISHTLSRDNIYDRSFGTTDADRTDLGKNGSLSKGRPMKGIQSDGELNHSVSPAMWRKWSIQRAGPQDIDFEAGEVALGKSWIEGTTETLGDDVVNITEKRSKALQRLKNDNHNEISTRLQHLELELSLTLRSLKSKSEELSSKEVFGSSPSDLQRLSDACEFQENEIMSARERLRLIRAQLAVLEGKMLLAIIDAQKMLDEKQKRIDSASKALQLLRTARIVWTNSASEVLLAGSFDGWTTQRKMEKLHTGVFAVSLKLYPGRYEIKFIVDGIWKIDPLRPTVHNNRHENNLLIIT